MERATARAEREQIYIMARGHRKADGARVFVVSSARNPIQGYIVALSGGRLQCECPSRKVCKHRALVHAELVREAAEEAAHVAAMDTAEDAWLLTRAGAAALAAHRAQAERREAAPLAHSSAAFSMWR